MFEMRSRVGVQSGEPYGTECENALLYGQARLLIPHTQQLTKSSSASSKRSFIFVTFFFYFGQGQGTEQSWSIAWTKAAFTRERERARCRITAGNTKGDVLLLQWLERAHERTRVDMTGWIALLFFLLLLTCYDGSESARVKIEIDMQRKMYHCN